MKKINSKLIKKIPRQRNETSKQKNLNSFVEI